MSDDDTPSEKGNHTLVAAAESRSRESDDGSEDADPVDFADMPPPMREMVSRFMAMSGPMPQGPSRILEKIPEAEAFQALTLILDTSAKKGQQAHEVQLEAVRADARQQGWSKVVAVIALVLVTGIIITCLVMDKDELAKLLIPLIAGLAAGGVGGYGLGKNAAQ